MSRNFAVSTVMILVAASAATLMALGGGTSDRELSLSKTSVFDVPEPPPERKNVSEPGELTVIGSDFPEQPPLVPHGIVDWLPITLEENQCLDCHAIEEKLEGEPTPIPISHYVDLRNAPDAVRDEIAGARYNCVTCHTTPGSNAPLVENTFGPSR
jgi:cytochrome c-type protein NapB